LPRDDPPSLALERIRTAAGNLQLCAPYLRADIGQSCRPRQFAALFVLELDPGRHCADDRESYCGRHDDHQDVRIAGGDELELDAHGSGTRPRYFVSLISFQPSLSTSACVTSLH